MKRLVLSLVIGATFILGAVASATAQSEHAVTVVSLDCQALNVGVGTVTVKGEVVATFSAPAKGSNGLGPCKPPLFTP